MKRVVTLHQKLRHSIHRSLSGTVCLWLFTRRKAFHAKKDCRLVLARAVKLLLGNISEILFDGPPEDGR